MSRSNDTEGPRAGGNHGQLVGEHCLEDVIKSENPQ